LRLDWFLGRPYVFPSVLLAVLLFLAGGSPFMIGGIYVRLVFCQHTTWLVNSASHRFGWRNFLLENVSTNSQWVALLAYGGGWHNNHAFPT
jgi:stearoyl-CoA desaturase (delta-9 desaturase)